MFTIQDESDLLSAVYDGPFEAPMWSTFLDRAARGTGLRAFVTASAGRSGACHAQQDCTAFSQGTAQVRRTGVPEGDRANRGRSQGTAQLRLDQTVWQYPITHYLAAQNQWFYWR